MPWTVGRVRITKFVELETVGGTRFILPQATPEAIRALSWLTPDFATGEGKLKMSIHTLMLAIPTRRILVNTGRGNDEQDEAVMHGRELRTARAGSAPPTAS